VIQECGAIIDAVGTTKTELGIIIIILQSLKLLFCGISRFWGIQLLPVLIHCTPHALRRLRRLFKGTTVRLIQVAQFMHL